MPQTNLPKDNCPKNLRLHLFCSTDICPIVFCSTDNCPNSEKGLAKKWLFKQNYYILHSSRQAFLTSVTKKASGPFVLKLKIDRVLYLSRVLFEFFFAEFFLSGKNKARPLYVFSLLHKAGVNSFKITQVSLFNSTLKNINNSRKKLNVHVCK